MVEKIIDRETPKKLYVQLYEILKGKIEEGEWVVGSQIPTEEDLCKNYNISKATVRLAVSELVRQGYLRRQQGKGTFVCKRVMPKGISMMTSFKENMLEAGVVFSTDVLAQTVVMPTDDLDTKLNIADDKHIIYIKRMRTVDGEPVMIQESYIPYHLCPHLLREDVANKSLLELLEKKYEIKIQKVKNYIDLMNLSAGDSRLLGLPKGSALAVQLEQHFYSGETQIMYMRSMKKPDKLRFFIEFVKKGGVTAGKSD